MCVVQGPCQISTCPQCWPALASLRSEASQTSALSSSRSVTHTSLLNLLGRTKKSCTSIAGNQPNQHWLLSCQLSSASGQPAPCDTIAYLGTLFQLLSLCAYNRPYPLHPLLSMLTVL